MNVIRLTLPQHSGKYKIDLLTKPFTLYFHTPKSKKALKLYYNLLFLYNQFASALEIFSHKHVPFVARGFYFIKLSCTSGFRPVREF